MPTKKSLLTSLKGKKISIITDQRSDAIDIKPIDRYGIYTHTITRVGEDLFEATGTQGGTSYFSIAHVRHVVV